MSESVEIRRKRLVYQAQHRGFKEADLLIGGFTAAAIGDLTPGELDELETLLRLPDHDLMGWALSDAAPPPEIDGPVFRRLRAFDVAAVIRRAPSG